MRLTLSVLRSTRAYGHSIILSNIRPFPYVSRTSTLLQTSENRLVTVATPSKEGSTRPDQSTCVPILDYSGSSRILQRMRDGTGVLSALGGDGIEGCVAIASSG